jgi:hypothetical protein
VPRPSRALLCIIFSTISIPISVSLSLYVMDPASITSLISFSIESITLIYKYVSGVKDAPKTVLRLQRELDLLKAVLRNLEALLKSPSQALQETSALFKAANKCNYELKELQNTLEGFSKRKSMRRVFHLLKWPLDEEDTLKIVESLHRYLTIFEFSLTIDGITLLSEHTADVQRKLESVEHSTLTTGTNIEDIRDAVKALDSHLRQIHHKENYGRFLDWLPALNHQEKHLDIGSRRLEGSGRWLIEEKVFRSWAEDAASNRTLFCHGGPGVGKTFLT